MRRLTHEDWFWGGDVFAALSTPVFYVAPEVEVGGKPAFYLIPELIELGKEFTGYYIPVDVWDFLPLRTFAGGFEPRKGFEAEELSASADTLSVLLFHEDLLDRLVALIPKGYEGYEVGAYFDTLDLEFEAGEDKLIVHIPVRFVVPQQRISGATWTDVGVEYPPLNPDEINPDFKLLAGFIKRLLEQEGPEFKRGVVRLNHSLHRHPGEFGFSSTDAVDLFFRKEEGKAVQLDGVFYHRGKEKSLPYFQAAQIDARQEGETVKQRVVFHPVTAGLLFKGGEVKIKHHPLSELGIYRLLRAAKENLRLEEEASENLKKLAEALLKEVAKATFGTWPETPFIRATKNKNEPLIAPYGGF